MKPARKFAQVSRRFYRPEQYHCVECQRRLRRAVTLTERTVITLEEVVKLVHAGYRCPDAQCAGHQRTYRSVRADALALPWFTYGVDIVLLVGRLRLREHQTVDEIHQELLKRLEPRVGGRHPAREGQRDSLPGARCAQRARASRRERHVIGDGSDARPCLRQWWHWG